MKVLEKLEDVIEIYSEFMYDLVRNELNFSYECAYTPDFYEFAAKATGAYAVYKIQSEGESPVEIDMDYINAALEYFGYEIEECDVRKLKPSDLDNRIRAMIEDNRGQNEYRLVSQVRDSGMYLVPMIKTEDNYNPEIEVFNASVAESVAISGMHPYVTSFSANMLTLDDERIPGLLWYYNGNDEPLILILA